MSLPIAPIDPADLADVVGGDSSGTSVNVPGASYSQTQTDYQKCVDTVTSMTRDTYPDTRFLGIFGTDHNAGPRADATMKNMRETCGYPPR